MRLNRAELQPFCKFAKFSVRRKQEWEIPVRAEGRQEVCSDSHCTSDSRPEVFMSYIPSLIEIVLADEQVSKVAGKSFLGKNKEC